MRDTAPGTGTRLLPKLKFEHVELTSFSKMRVDLAAQVRWFIHTVLWLLFTLAITFAGVEFFCIQSIKSCFWR